MIINDEQFKMLIITPILLILAFLAYCIKSVYSFLTDQGKTFKKWGDGWKKKALGIFMVLFGIYTIYTLLTVVASVIMLRYKNLPTFWFSVLLSPFFIIFYAIIMWGFDSKDWFNSGINIIFAVFLLMVSCVVSISLSLSFSKNIILYFAPLYGIIGVSMIVILILHVVIKNINYATDKWISKLLWFFTVLVIFTLVPILYNNFHTIDNSAFTIGMNIMVWMAMLITLVAGFSFFENDFIENLELPFFPSSESFGAQTNEKIFMKLFKHSIFYMLVGYIIFSIYNYGILKYVSEEKNTSSNKSDNENMIHGIQFIIFFMFVIYFNKMIDAFSLFQGETIELGGNSSKYVKKFLTIVSVAVIISGIVFQVYTGTKYSSSDMIYGFSIVLYFVLSIFNIFQNNFQSKTNNKKVKNALSLATNFQFIIKFSTAHVLAMITAFIYMVINHPDTLTNTAIISGASVGGILLALFIVYMLVKKTPVIGDYLSSDTDKSSKIINTIGFLLIVALVISFIVNVFKVNKIK